jgi:hypothetical protein
MPEQGGPTQKAQLAAIRPMARRRPEAVRELEALQQDERKGAGEPELTVDDFLRLLREDVEMDLISARLESGGLEAQIQAIPADKRLTEERVAALLKAWQVSDPSQWSRFETSGTRCGLADVCGRIEASFARHNRRLPEFPVVGTLTTGQVAAATQLGESGVPLVLINNGFFKFSGAMSQLAVFSSYDAQVKSGFTDATLKLVSDLAATQTVMNTCLYLYKRKTPPEVAPSVAEFQDAIIMFVISHEYAHVAAGDLDAHPLGHAHEQTSLRSKEFEADKVAFETTVEENADPESGVFGPFLYFAGLDLLDRAAAAYKGRPAPSPDTSPSEYPTPFERTVKLLEWLETTPYKQRFATQIRAAHMCYNTILFAWDEIMPALWDAREELSAFDTSIHGPSPYLDADVFGVVTTLWKYVLARRGQA